MRVPGERWLLLCQVGRRAGASSGLTGLVHRLSLVLAAAFVLATFFLFLAGNDVSAQRQHRLDAREPIFAASAGSPDVVARWNVRDDYFVDRQFLLLYVAPLRASAPPPPGLPRWPEPGEAFLSPALAAADRQGSVHHRYGTFGGTIASDGLADPDEWVVYLRPSDDARFDRYDGRTAITGFGRHTTPDDPARTDNEQTRTLGQFYWLLIVVCATPAALLLVVAARSSSEVRDRRRAMLSALGASPAATACVIAGEAAVPILLGAAIGYAATLLVSFTGVWLPLADYRVSAGDLARTRAGSAWLSLFTVVLLIALVTAVNLRDRTTRGSTAPRAVSARIRAWPLLLFMCSLAVLIWLATTAYQEHGLQFNSLRVQAFLAIMVVNLATLPAVVGTIAKPVGLAAARLGNRRGSVPAIVGGRWLADRSGPTARMAAAVVVGLGILSISQVLVAQAAQARETVAVRSAVGDRIVTIRSRGADQDAARFVRAVGADRVFTVATDATGRPMLVGSCQAMAALGPVPDCPAGARPISAVTTSASRVGWALRAGIGSIDVGGDFPVATQMPSSARITSFIVLNSGGGAGFDAVAGAAFRELAMPEITTSGQLAIAGAVDLARTYSWLSLFGSAGAGVLVVAALIGALDVFIEQARALGPLGTMVGDRRVYFATAGWNVTLPLVVATAAGGLFAALLGFLFTRMRSSGTVSVGTLAVGCAIVVVFACIAGVTCGAIASRSAARWRPTAD